ncbi:hypothetical protein C8R42DRAFT_727815 [Lentinula raphanica]|nr:hypothetical protein C8R42DRAFT_727815 [Lentinula raphanica]
MRQQPSEVSQSKDPSQLLPSSFVANPGSGRSHTGPPETSSIVNEDQSYMSNSSAERDHHDLSSNEGNHSLNFIATESGNPKLVLDPFAATTCLQSKEWPSLSDILNVDEMLGNLDPNQARIEYWAGLNSSSGSQLNSIELMTVDYDVDPFDDSIVDDPDNFNLNVSLGYIDPSLGTSALPSSTVSAIAHSQSISPTQSFGAFSGSAPSSYGEKHSASYPIPESTPSYPASSESASKQRLYQEAASNLNLNDSSLIGSYDLRNHTSFSSRPTNLQTTYVQPQSNLQTKVYGWNPQAQTHLIHPYPPSSSQFPLHQSYPGQSSLRSDSISKTGDVGPVISAYPANPIAPQHQPLQTAFWANQTPQPPSAHFDMMMTDGGNGSALYAPDELVVASC